MTMALKNREAKIIKTANPATAKKALKGLCQFRKD